MAPEARFSPGERRLEWPEAREWLRGRRRGVRGEPRRSTRESRGVHPGGRRRTRESPRGVLCGTLLPAASSPGSPGDRTSCAPRRPGDGGCRSHITAVGEGTGSRRGRCTWSRTGWAESDSSSCSQCRSDRSSRPSHPAAPSDRRPALNSTRGCAGHAATVWLTPHLRLAGGSAGPRPAGFGSVWLTAGIGQRPEGQLVVPPPTGPHGGRPP